MLLVLASKWDEQAIQLVRSCDNARLLTLDDLSVSGWVFRGSRLDHGAAVAAGEIIVSGEIEGVFTRLPGVMPHELLQIAPSERDYVAAEMHAFLVAWLSALKCPVVNRPTPGCLAGPAWGQERWIWEAAKHGIPIVQLDRDTEVDAHFPVADSAITVVGDTVLGANEPRWSEFAIELARAAGVIAMTAYFDKDGLRSAYSTIDIGKEGISRALLQFFGMRSQNDPAVGTTQ